MRNTHIPFSLFPECQLRDQQTILERQDVTSLSQLRAERLEEGLLLQLLQVARGACQAGAGDRRQQVPRHTLPEQKQLLQEDTAKHTQDTPKEEKQTKCYLPRRSMQRYRLRRRRLVRWRGIRNVRGH